MTDAAEPGAAPVLPPESAAAPAPSPSPPRAAAAARIFGALLWAYVVLGEWVVGRSLPEPFAVLCVAAVFGCTWLTSVGRNPGTPALDKIMPGAFAFALWALLLLLSSALPSNGEPSHVEAVSASLCFVGAAAFFVASAWYGAPAPHRTLGQRWARWLVWCVVGGGTLLAIVSGSSRF
jgi:hypothetical protein